MQIRMNNTIRNVLVATVACGLFVSACASKDAKMQQPLADLSGLRAPAKNPGMKAAVHAQMQEDELVQVVAEDEVSAVAEDEEVELVSSHSAYQPVPEQKKSWFNWGTDEQPIPPVAQGERKVPMLNAAPSADYQAMAEAAPTGVVEEDSLMAYGQTQPVAAASSTQVIVAEEVAMFQEEYVPQAAPQAPQYPHLSSVPLRPERLDAVQEADAKMAQLQHEQQQSRQQVAVLEQQVASDAQGSLLPNKPMVDPEFAAIVGADESVNTAGLNHGKEVVIVEQAQPVDYAAQAPIRFEDVENVQPELPVAASQPVAVPSAQPQQVASAPAVPVTPVFMQDEVIVEEAVATHAPIAPQADEWVSLQADPAQQMAQPIEQVDVMQTPDVAYVPDAVSPQAIQLTPPSVTVREQRVLPESRYAARRQAVYAQRYNRVQLVDGK